MLQRRIGMICPSRGWAVWTSPRANSSRERDLRLTELKDKVGSIYHAGVGSTGRMRRICCPTFNEPLKIIAIGMNPKRSCRATAARPADAMHPHCVQSGTPPYWHGVIFVVRSAEMVAVVRANTQSSGDAGGSAYTSMSPLGSASFG